MAQTGDNVIPFPNAIISPQMTDEERQFLDDVGRMTKPERTMFFALMRMQAILNDTLASLGGSHG